MCAQSHQNAPTSLMTTVTSALLGLTAQQQCY